MNDMDSLIKDYCKTNEIKRFGPEVRTSCYCCNKGWNGTFLNIRYKGLPPNCVICFNCKKKANKKKKLSNISIGEAVQYLQDTYKKPFVKTKTIDIAEIELGTSALKSIKSDIKYGINRQSNPWR